VRILVVNCGSSSLKHAVFDVVGDGAPRRLAGGAIACAAGEHGAALESAIGDLRERGVLEGLVATAHRVVHGALASRAGSSGAACGATSGATPPAGAKDRCRG
jgi:acetate kinase